MVFDPTRAGLRTLLWLWAIVAFSALVAAIWSVRVPFYQQPDELAHVDYIFELFDVGHPFRVTGRHPGGEVAPQTRFVERAVGYRPMRYDPYARAPAAYGTASFFRRLDMGAPKPSGKTPEPGAAVPYLMYNYPPGFYVIEAAILAATFELSGSISDGLFAMRASNVMLFAGTLFLSFFALRAYGIKERSSLLAVLAIGTFPLMTSVSSYVQPDNATTFLIAVIVFAVARGRLHRSRNADVLALAGLVALFLVKPHYAFAAWLVTVPLLTFQNDRRPLHPALRLGICIVPLVVFAISNRYLNPVSGIESPLAWVDRTHRLSSASPYSVANVLWLFADAIGELLNGSVFFGFWFAFGFRGGRIFSESAMGPIFKALTVIGFATFLFAERTVLRRIWFVAKKFDRRVAMQLLLRNHPANLYLVTTGMLVSAHALSGGALELEGRYWCAMLLPLVIVTLRTLPRPMAANVRRYVVNILPLAMATYSLFASLAAFRAMNADFYGRRAPQYEAVADLIALRASGNVSGDSHHLTLPYPQPVHISGYAIDMLTGLAARSVYVEVDRRARIGATRVALPYADVAQIFNDDRVASTRFAVDVPAGALPAGRHRLRFFVGAAARTDGIPFWNDAWIVVGSEARREQPVIPRSLNGFKVFST